MQHEEIEKGRTGIQVIARAAAILRAMKENPSGMSLGRIASSVGLPRSTVQRIVRALQSERFVISDANGGGLRLGPELGALAEATRYNTVEQCRILLTELTQATGETSDLSVLRGETMIFLDQVPGTHRLRTISSVGEVFPLTTTANGRACLARMARPRALERARREWSRRKEATSEEQFNALLDDIAENGIAYDENEHTDGISAIGFAFEDWAGDLMAISVPVPSSRINQRRADIENAIRTTQAHVDKMMRYGSGG